MYVYILRSTKFPKQIYIGKTSNLKKRLLAHNQSINPSTSKYKPWKIIWYARFENAELADNFEIYLKTGSGYAFRNKRLTNNS